jgi:GxxExxY protein
MKRWEELQEGGKAGRREGFGDGSAEVIAACIEVHRHLGPGLLESTYEACLAEELRLRSFRVETQRKLPLVYKGVRLEQCYRLDLIVEEALLAEIKSVDQLHPVHEAQVLTYLRLSGLRTALLVNFHVPVLRHGLRRLHLDPETFPPSRLPAFPPSSRDPDHGDGT